MFGRYIIVNDVLKIIASDIRRWPLILLYACIWMFLLPVILDFFGFLGLNTLGLEQYKIGFSFNKIISFYFSSTGIKFLLRFFFPWGLFLGCITLKITDIFAIFLNFSKGMDKVDTKNTVPILFSQTYSNDNFSMRYDGKNKRILIDSKTEENSGFESYIIKGSTYYNIKYVYKKISSSVNKSSTFQAVITLAQSMCCNLQKRMLDKDGNEIEIPAEISTKDDLRPEIAKIDINNCTKQDLLKLPYINDRIAQNIMDYKKEHIPFESIERFFMLFNFSGYQKGVLRKYIFVSKTKIPREENIQPDGERRVDF